MKCWAKGMHFSWEFCCIFPSCLKNCFFFSFYASSLSHGWLLAGPHILVTSTWYLHYFHLYCYYQSIYHILGIILLWVFFSFFVSFLLFVLSPTLWWENAGYGKKTGKTEVTLWMRIFSLEVKTFHKEMLFKSQFEASHPPLVSWEGSRPTRMSATA